MFARVGKPARMALSALTACAVVVVGLGLVVNSAQAGSSVVPRNGIRGVLVVGNHDGRSNLAMSTMLFEVELNGSAAYVFSTDISRAMEFGVGYDETGWTNEAVPHVAEVSRILSRTTADEPGADRALEIAAAQAAVWKFTDGFELDPADGRNNPAVLARASDLIADALAHPARTEATGTLAVTPDDRSVPAGSAAYFDIVTSSSSPLSIELSDAAVSAHRVIGNTCDTTSAVTEVVATSGVARICLTSTQALAGARLTVRTTTTPVSAGRVFERPGRRKLILGKAGVAQSSATVSASWSGAGRSTDVRPRVDVSCPNEFSWGEPEVIIANGTDPAGDVELRYEWSLNGRFLNEEHGPKVTIRLAPTDRLGVVVSDPAGRRSNTAVADCH